jgi:hypothetical protein
MNNLFAYMLLNELYYRNLYKRYQDDPILPQNLKDKTSILTLKIILDHCRRRKSLHINFQTSFPIEEIAQHLFIELSNKIFCNMADFPPLNIGDKVRSKREISVGTPKPQFLDFEIVGINNRNYTLRNKKHSITWEKEYSKLVENFIPVTQYAQNQTLTRFISYFENLNGKPVHDFTPTYFEQKSVFIASKSFFDSLNIKNKIPITYYPNSQQETPNKEIKTIPALPDSIMFFVPRYEMAYQNRLLQDRKIETIVLLDTEENNIQQIIQDKNRFGFNIIQLTTSLNIKKAPQIPCWNWFKEEIDIINSL